MIQFKNKNQSQEENFKEWVSLTTKTRKDFDNDSNYEVQNTVNFNVNYKF